VDPRLRKYSIAYAVLVAVHVVIGIAAGPLVSGYMASAGGSVPLLSELVAGLSAMYLLAPMLIVLDIAVFAPLYLLARFYRGGFIIAAVAVNLAITAALAYAVYLPRLEVITLVK